MRVILLVLCALVSATSACLAQQREIRLAFVGPLSGPRAPLGIEIRQGILFAIAEAEGASAEANRANFGKITIDIEDDSCAPTKAADVARRLLEKHPSQRPAAVIGHVCASTDAAVARLYSDAQVLQIEPWAQPVGFLSAGTRNRLQFGLPIEQDAEDVARAISETVRSARFAPHIAIFAGATATGMAAAQAARVTFRSILNTETPIVKLEPGATALPTLTGGVTWSGLTYLMTTAQPSEVAELLALLGPVASRPPLVGLQPLSDASFVREIRDGTYGDKIKFRTSGLTESLSSNVAQRLRQQGVMVTEPILRGIVAAEIAIFAVRQARSDQLDAMLAALRDREVPTSAGIMKVAPEGSIARPGPQLFGKWDRAGPPPELPRIILVQCCGRS